jgi:hypothetical protein
VRPDDRALLIAGLPTHGEWSRPNSPLAKFCPGAAGVHWTSAARRITLTGSASTGLETAESGAVRLSSDAVVFAAPQPPEPDRLLVSPSEVQRIFRGDSERLVERWIAALEVPVAFWELDASDTLAFAKCWRIAAGGRAATTTIDPDGRVAIAAAGDSGPRVVFVVDGGRLMPGPAGPGPAAISVTGSGRVRLMIVIAAGDADLDRTLQVVARRGFTGLHAQRLQHERLLRDYGAALSTPLARLDSQFEWAKALSDEEVRARQSVAAAEALLGVGLRDGARELLKAGCEALAQAWSAWVGDAGLAGAVAGPAPLTPVFGPAADAPDAAAELAPDRLLRWVTTTLWGIVADAPGQAVSLAPRLPAGWTRMALARIRVGRSAIDCDLRVRAPTLIVRVRRASGPPLTVTLAPAGVATGGISVDGIELAGGRARFEAIGEHEAVFEQAS